MRRSENSAWKFANGDLASALQNGNAFAGPRQPRGGDTPTIARPNHDGIVIRPDQAKGRGKSLHRHPESFESNTDAYAGVAPAKQAVTRAGGAITNSFGVTTAISSENAAV